MAQRDPVPAPQARDATIEGVVRHWSELMTRSASWHAPEFLSIDVTMAQAKVLHLAALEPATRMSSLAARLGVTLPTLSGVVDRLVGLSCLERRADSSDRRQVMVAVTPQGAEVIERFRELGSRTLRTLLSGLEPDELAGLARGVAALVARAEAVGPSASPGPSQPHHHAQERTRP
jgi:DNA-binding MarR family transcriptional regulator